MSSLNICQEDCYRKGYCERSNGPPFPISKLTRGYSLVDDVTVILLFGLSIMDHNVRKSDFETRLCYFADFLPSSLLMY
jgi:hypothetical protein